MKILLTGGTGFLGTHVFSELMEGGYDVNSYGSEYDLREYDEAKRLLNYTKPDTVINLAANVGGIQYNLTNPYQLYKDNVLINFNMIDASREFEVKKFIQIGTTCSYPSVGLVPFVEEEFWDGYPEESNAPYGIAKKMALVQLQYSGMDWLYLVLANLYGPNDSFDDKKSHVIPALIKKFVTARDKKLPEVVVWGNGEATRDFLYVTDAAKCIAKTVGLCNNNIMYNVGSGKNYTILEVAELIKEITGYQGNVVFDTSKPDGQRNRLLDIGRIYPFWKPEKSLRDGLMQTIAHYEVVYA